ncbi:MAG: vanadium-dependent haloperoxidase [Flammeovirgaceae bacterium]|jgi:hypothetical protein|nr:vanadium-dependent haloperoxidase [Flammeovirgaceae bacterium]|tara:strand:+ start:13418 stop:14863 length:1446 start_codon:yes stop_codon:yes gene_type:complete
MRFVILFFLILLAGCEAPKKSLTHIENPLGDKNIAYYWAQVALAATANDTELFRPRPTITSRYLGLIFISIFDAWSVYEPAATPVYLEEIEKAPVGLRTLKNKEIAISYAAYYALKEYYFSDSLMFKQKMEDLGLNPVFKGNDPSSPERIGMVAAVSVINARKGDGSNQYGEELAGKESYFDYSFYKPINTLDENSDINRWQPKYFTDAQGVKFAPKCLTPYWQKVIPITMASADQFRSPPPPYYGSDQLKKEVVDVVEMQANLTVQQKGLVEFMRDGPRSVQQAGHWLVFAQEVSKRDLHNLDEDVKMYFLNQITAMDAFIASWDTKMYYDFARPYALVHEYFQDQEIVGWAGYGKGWESINGNQWRPYSPDVFLCPPFPSYVSGHSTVSGACAEALKLFKGADEFGMTVPFIAGSFTESEENWEEINIYFPTFTEAAEMAGLSRVLGGYHIQADNIEGLVLGRKVAQNAYRYYLKHVGD